MTAEPDLLPVAVSPYTDRILAAVRAQDCTDPLFQILDDYARANVAHATTPLQAEIEALRAEVRTLVRQNGEWQARVKPAEPRRIWVNTYGNRMGLLTPHASRQTQTQTQASTASSASSSWRW